MILDANFSFTGGTVPPGSSDGLTDAPTTGTQVSSRIIDLHMSGIPLLANLQGARDMGIGDDPSLKLMIDISTTFLSGTSLSIQLQAAPDNGSGAPGAFATWYTTPVVAEASLLAGLRLFDIDLPRPPPLIGIPRFLQLQYTNVGTHTAGKLYGHFVLDRIDQYFSGTNTGILGGYPPGITIPN